MTTYEPSKAEIDAAAQALRPGLFTRPDSEVGPVTLSERADARYKARVALVAAHSVAPEVWTHDEVEDINRRAHERAEAFSQFVTPSPREDVAEQITHAIENAEKLLPGGGPVEEAVIEGMSRATSIARSFTPTPPADMGPAAALHLLTNLSERQIRNLGHVMEQEQSNARFHDDQRTDLRDVAAEAAITWVTGLLGSEEPSTYRSEPRTYAEYRAARTTDGTNS